MMTETPVALETLYDVKKNVDFDKLPSSNGKTFSTEK